MTNASHTTQRAWRKAQLGLSSGSYTHHQHGETLMTYRAPIRDLVFALTDVVDIDQVCQDGAFAEFDHDLMQHFV